MIFSPMATVSIAVAGMTSPQGRCFTFDQRASGYCRGEGAVAVHVTADGDDSKSRFLGSAVRAHGKSASLTAPNSPMQIELLLVAQADAAISQDDLSHVECHGELNSTLERPI